jgi:hypothetical protein
MNIAGLILMANIYISNIVELKHGIYVWYSKGVGVGYISCQNETWDVSFEDDQYMHGLHYLGQNVNCDIASCALG